MLQTVRLQQLSACQKDAASTVSVLDMKHVHVYLCSDIRLKDA